VDVWLKMIAATRRLRGRGLGRRSAPALSPAQAQSRSVEQDLAALVAMSSNRALLQRYDGDGETQELRCLRDVPTA
jgi:hypothetical protein